MRVRSHGSFLLVVAATLAVGCGEAPASLPDGATAGDAGPTLPPDPADRVDLLLVVSGRYYAQEHQARLGAEIEPLLAALRSGDVDGDGAADQRPATSIRVGVVTADLGAPGGTASPWCDARGDDALLREGMDLPGVVGIDAGTDLGEATVAIAAAIAIGNDDCFLVQSFEAALKALSPRAPTAWTAPAYVPPTFASGAGHGDGANSGLARDGSVLVVVFLAAHDDGSVLDPELYAVDSTRYEGPLGTRAARYPEALQGVARYADGLLALRAHPGRLVVASIAGMPSIDDPLAADLDALLADDAMRLRFEGAELQQVPSCSPSGVANAGWPARRHVELARMLRRRGAGTVLASICDPFARARTALARAIGRALEGAATR